MNSRNLLRTARSKEIEVGSIIIAQPFWQDEKYKRSVIIVLTHDDIGTTGIILNKETTLLVKDVLPTIMTNIPLNYGGPFDTHTISYLHNNSSVPEAISLGNQIYWGGNFENIEQAIKEKTLDCKKIKFFAGFVEWHTGQLQEEINENKWWVSEMNANELFNTSSDSLWSHELLINGNIYGLLDEFPDPSLN